MIPIVFHKDLEMYLFIVAKFCSSKIETGSKKQFYQTTPTIQSHVVYSMMKIRLLKCDLIMSS